MQRNQERLIINRIVFRYHEFQRMIGKLMNIEYVTCIEYVANYHFFTNPWKICK